jgi:hypothetical protein
VAAAAATAVIALAAAGIVDAATGGVAPQESPSYGRRTLECPSQFALPHQQGAPEQPTLAAAPADSTAVLLCAQNVAPGSASHLRLQPEPLTSVTDQDGVRRLVLALQSAPELGNTRACGIRAPFRVLVFLHPGGQQAYSVQLTKSCSFISDGSTHRSVPQEVAALIPADGEAAEARPAGATATWVVDPDERPTSDALSVAVLVTRLGCAGGETGRVLPPVVREEGEQVVVTFAAEALPVADNTCQGNKPVAQTFALDRPLGTRTLIDGACLSGEAVLTGPCVEGAQRWPAAR